MANWVCRSLESLYEPYAQLTGAFFELITRVYCTTWRTTSCLRYVSIWSRYLDRS